MDAGGNRKMKSLGPAHSKLAPTLTGDFEDGLGNKLPHAYANPEDRNDELKDGRFRGGPVQQKDRSITFECWPRFSKVSDGDQAQFPGWPVTFKMTQNDGRK